MIAWHNVDNISRWLEKYGGYFGWGLVIVPWILFGICYLVNPQWVLTRDALSSFGDPSFSQYPWVYNVGLGVISIIIFIMSLGIISTAENKILVMGGSLWFVAGIFLALIGYFHGGTYPHDFVSTWFFIQAAFAISVIGIGSYLSLGFRYSVIPILLSLSMELGDIFIPFPSAATTEIFEIIIIDLWALFALIYVSRAEIRLRKSGNTGAKRSTGAKVTVTSLALAFYAIAIAIIAL